MLGLRTIARRASGLALVGAVLGSVLGPATPTLAAAREQRDPANRIEVFVKSVHVIDDNDPGDGEMNFEASFTCFSAPSPCLGDPQATIDLIVLNFDASDGQTVQLHKVLPASNDKINFYSEASAQSGYPVYFGHRYELAFRMTEMDDWTDLDRMGTVTQTLEQPQNWAIGSHTKRSVQSNGQPGDFEIEYEIRLAPLPDLKPTSMEVTRPAGATAHHICVAVNNGGMQSVPQFGVMLHLDNAAGNIGFTNGGTLDPGQTKTVCVDATLPIGGIHKLTAHVDKDHIVFENNEVNNRLEQGYDPKGINSTRPTGPMVNTQTGTGAGTKVTGAPAPATPSPTPAKKSTTAP